MSCYILDQTTSKITVQVDLTAFALCEPDFKAALELLNFYFCYGFPTNNPNFLSRCILTLLPILIGGIQMPFDGYGLSSPFNKSYDELCYVTGVRYKFKTNRDIGTATASVCRKPPPNLRRYTTNVLSQSLRRREETLFGGLEDFEKFMRVWLGRIDTTIANRVRRLPLDRDFSMELCIMANYCYHLALSPDIYSCRSLSALALLLESIFGKSGAMDFWRLSSLPVDRYFQDPEDDFQGSVVQKALHGGESV
nr:MAG: viral suppressor of RNA silencing [Plant associated polerovirus 2]